MDEAVWQKPDFGETYGQEGCRFVASADIWIPFFVCTLNCECVTDAPLNDLDLAVCRCAREGITEEEDISYVLGLSRPLVAAEAERLRMLELLDEACVLTARGARSLQTSFCAQRVQRKLPALMNGITGQWSAGTGEELVQTPPEDEIVPDPLHAVFLPVSERSVLRELEAAGDIGAIRSAVPADYRTVAYRRELVLFYTDQEDQVLITILDPDSEEVDLPVTAALQNAYARRELLALMRAERFLRQPEQAILNEKLSYAQYGNPVSGGRYYRNREIRDLFKQVFDLAEQSVFIVSPWIDNSGFVVTEALLNKLEWAIREKGLRITIGYGYLSPEKMEKLCRKYAQAPDSKEANRDKNWQTWLMAEKMKARFQDCSGFSMLYIGTHEKILSYDGRYTLIGSYNLLSYDGGEMCQYRGYHFRFEGGTLIDDPEFAQHMMRVITNGAAL